MTNMLLEKGDKGKTVRYVQQVLVKLGLMQTDDIDGSFGGKTEAAVEQFQISKNLKADGKVGNETMTALQAADGVVNTTTPQKVDDKKFTDLAGTVLKTLRAGNFNVAVGADVMNIVYVEGMDPDGTPNKNRPNAFDATRLLLRVANEGGVEKATILGAWDATTHPGIYWETHPMNKAGAFHIALGQQACWIMGHYHNMEALVQYKDITGTRDAKEDFKRAGPTVHGQWGVHHHWGYDFPKDNLGKSSAGCQVGRLEAGHNQFIALLKTDSRYKVDHKFVFSSTVLQVENLGNDHPDFTGYLVMPT